MDSLPSQPRYVHSNTRHNPRVIAWSVHRIAGVKGSPKQRSTYPEDVVSAFAQRPILEVAVNQVTLASRTPVQDR